MASVLPVVAVVAKGTIKKGEFQQLITVPKDKSHATVDVTMYYKSSVEVPEKKAVLNFYLSDFEDNAGPHPKYLLFKGVELDSRMVYPELGKIIIGANQTLCVEHIDGEPVNIRVSGLTETNAFVKRAGRLNSVVVPNTKLTEVFRHDNPLGAYITGTLSTYNPSKDKTSKTKVYITDNTNKPLDYDLIMEVDVTPGDTAFIENILLRPNERILVQSDVADMPFFMNGIDVSAVFGDVCLKDEPKLPDGKDPK